MRFAIPVGILATGLLVSLGAQSARPPFQHSYAEVNGQRLHYASIGKGPLVLFLHGYPAFWYQWKDQMAEMGRDVSPLASTCAATTCRRDHRVSSPTKCRT
jgi:hypothetical protein